VFVPNDYRAQDPAWALDLVRRHPLALLVTAGGDALFTTHVPAIPDAESLHDGTGGLGLVGTVFLGHMNRRNPHWAQLRDGLSGLLVFHGPEVYISPLMYETSPAAPTWNFTAVHLRGTVERIDDAQKMEVLLSTVTTYERDHGGGWDPSDSLEYFAQLAPDVGAFRFAVATAEGMFKLSQEKPVTIREKVIDALAGDPSGRAREVAETMRRYHLGAA
jgi:transcriptional regulator